MCSWSINFTGVRGELPTLHGYYNLTALVIIGMCVYIAKRVPGSVGSGDQDRVATRLLFCSRISLPSQLGELFNVRAHRLPGA